MIDKFHGPDPRFKLKPYKHCMIGFFKYGIYDLEFVQCKRFQVHGTRMLSFS